MKSRQAVFYRQFLAVFTILSLTFTQALPSFALRPEGVSGATTRSGLEESLLQGSPIAASTHLPSGAVADLNQLVSYFSKHPTWVQARGSSDEANAPLLVELLSAAMRGEDDTPLPIVRALSSPAQIFPLALRLITPTNPELHQRIDAQWAALQQQCAICASHILHENIEETRRRDLAGHPFRDLLAAVITAYDAKKLGRIPTRRVNPEIGHTEHEVPTQTAYGVQMVGALQAIQVRSGADVIRALAQLLPRDPESDSRSDSLPVVHVRALGSPAGVPGNHYVGVRAVDRQNGKIYILDNGQSFELTILQFLRQYSPMGVLLVSSDQDMLLESADFKFERPSEKELLRVEGDCGTCAFKGDFPIGYHAPIAWALKSAERLLYRGADGGGVQVRYELGGQLLSRFYRVSYNSTTQVMTFKVAEIGPDQKETVLHERSLSIMEAVQAFGVTPAKAKRFMAKFLADLANRDEYRIDKEAKLLDVVMHFRWATHGESDIWGTHPHEARPDEVVRRNGTPAVAKTVTVSHNGVVYDFIDLGIKLADEGHTFETSVDSERFAHLVWEIINHEKPPTLLEAVRRALGRIQLNDTYGFQVTSNDYPGEVISARNESPIYLGISDGALQDGRGKAVPFFMTAADPKAILPHTSYYSTLLPNRAIAQVTNDRITVVDLEGNPYYLVLQDGTVTQGKREDGQMVPVQVAVHDQEDDSTNPARVTATLTRPEIQKLLKNKLTLSAEVNGQLNRQIAGAIVFQKGKDQPEVYDLGDYPDYTTKELYQSGKGMRDTIAKNTIQVPVYYIPRHGVQVQPDVVKVYRSSDVENRLHPMGITLTTEQVARITGPDEWTELVLRDDQYYFVKLTPNISTPWYDTLLMPDFKGVRRWSQLREVDRVWLVSVGSSWNSDLDGARFIRRYAKLPVEVLNSDQLRDDPDWITQAAGNKKIAVLATTQSGTTAVTKANMEKIKKASGKREANGTLFLSIADTNNPGSDITQSDFTEEEINEGLPPEIGVLSTAVVPAQKENKELFGMRLGIERRVMRPEAVHDRIEELLQISHEVDAVLKDKEIEQQQQLMAEELVRANQCKVCYRGPAMGAAYEATIKLEEGGEINAVPYNMGTYLHGPAQLLQASKVPVGVTAAVTAQYDPTLQQIVHTVQYSDASPEAKRRGFPLLVFYIPTEEDEATRGRLESNFQTVNSREASVHLITSKTYASQLLERKMVTQAIGVPANEYTLTALGQKLALLVADIKNTRLAEQLFSKARAIQERQVADIPTGVPSREEWVRQALVDAYAEVVRLRENGWLSQILHQEGAGFLLAKINAAAQHPENKILVDETRDLLARLVNFVDVAQPGKLAKSVTVEARFDAVTRDLLHSVGIPNALMDTQLRGLLRIEGNQIRAYPGVLDLVSRLVKKPQNELLRVGLHHEGAEFLLRFGKAGPRIQNALERDIPADERASFQRRFEDEFGRVEGDQWPYEIAAQYYTALFMNNTDKLDRIFGQAVGRSIQKSVGGVSLSEEVVGVRDLDQLLALGRAEYSDLETNQIRTLQRVARVVKQFSQGKIDLSVVFDNRITEIEAARKLLSGKFTVQAGLEEVSRFELRTMEVLNQIQSSKGSVHTADDARDDWQVLNQIRPILEDLGADAHVLYGDPLGRGSWSVDASGLDARPFLRLRAEDFRRMSIAPAYRFVEGVPPQRVLQVVLFGDIRHSARYWAIPVDLQLKEHLTAFYKSVFASTPPAPIDPVEQKIQDLIRQFGSAKEKILLFEAVEEQGPPVQTTLLLVGHAGTSGSHDVVVHALAARHINIRHIATEDRDKGIGVDRLVVDAPVQTLESQGVLSRIQEGLRRLFPSDRERALYEQLSSRLSAQEIRWFADLLSQVPRELDGVEIAVQPEDDKGITHVLAATPFEPPLPLLDEPLTHAIEQSASEEARKLGKEVVPPVAPITVAINELKGTPSIALFLMTFRGSPEHLFELGVTDAVEEVLGKLARQPRIGKQLPAAAPADRVILADRIAAARGWVLDSATHLYRTPQGGWVSPEAILSIDPTATVRNGSLVRGDTTRLEADVVVDRSLVEDAVVGEGSMLEGAIVRTDPAVQDLWAWNSIYRVDIVRQTTIGKNVHIDLTVDGEPAEVINARVGDRSEVLGGSIRNSEIGSDNKIVRAKVGLTHTEDHVTIQAKNGAPIEVSESWLGWGRTIDTESYNEHLSPNFIRRAYVAPDGTVRFETVKDIPAVVLQGYSTIDASYDGTGKYGNEFKLSRHGSGVKFPGSIIGPVTNMILLVHPDFQDPADLLREESFDRKTPHGHLTALHPFSYSHRLEGRDVGEVWGQVVPGAARFGLNSEDVNELWVFEHAQPAIQEILAEMHQQVDLHAETAGWDSVKRRAVHAEVDKLPGYALETGKAIARLTDDRVLEARYDAHLNGKSVEVESKTLADLLATDDPTQHDWQNYPLLTQEDAETLAQLPPGIEISATSQIGKGARIIGARTRLDGVTVPAGATVFVWNSAVKRSVLSDGVQLRNVVLGGSSVGPHAQLSNVRAEGTEFGERVGASQTVVLQSSVGSRSTLEPYARLINTTMGPDGSMGAIARSSEFSTGITNHHPSRTRLDHVVTRDYEVEITGPTGTRVVRIPNMTNISAGTIAQGTAVKPIVLQTTMLGANTAIPPGVTAGFLSFMKNVGQTVPAFAMSRAPGQSKISAGFTARYLSSMIMRLLGKTLDKMPESDRPALNAWMDKQLAEAGLDNQRDGRWVLPLSGPIQSAADLGDPAKGKWFFRPKFTGDQGYGSNPIYEWVPKAPAAGLEETWNDLITQLPSASAVESSVGVIAGKDPTGLAYGVALSRRATIPGGKFMPVAFVVENDAQATTLGAMGFTSGEIFRDVEAARQWLKDELKAEKIEELGTNGPVTGVVQALLKNLFGIELKPGEIAIWQSFVEKVRGIFASQV